VRPWCGAGGKSGTRVGRRERERERAVARVWVVTELGGLVFEITHDLAGDLFRA
jgi:hypothetical protein